MINIFNRSKAGDYKAKPSGVGGLLRADTFVVRIVIFALMSLVFFGILKITERKIPHGLVPDSTDDSGAVHQPTKAAPPPPAKAPAVPAPKAPAADAKAPAPATK